MLDRIAIACTDKPPRLACDRGTICQIVPHTQLQTDLVGECDCYAYLGNRALIRACISGAGAPLSLKSSWREGLDRPGARRHGLATIRPGPEPPRHGCRSQAVLLPVSRGSLPLRRPSRTDSG